CHSTLMRMKKKTLRNKTTPYRPGSSYSLQCLGFMNSFGAIMHRLTSLLILALATSFSTAAMANNNGYAALGYAFSKVEPKNSRKGANVDALQFGFGGWF